MALLLLVSAPSVYAENGQNPRVDINHLLTIAKSKQLYLKPDWLALMHYQPTGDNGVSFESQVDDERYFLARNGRTNSLAEMSATINIMFGGALKTTTEQDNPHCGFVERERWLREQLSLSAQAVPASCTEFHQWRDRMEAHSVTLVFPASYLNSPSSMFGHTLFRFDPENIADDSSWLSFALSFAADVEDSEGDSFSYAFKGIAGGYAGRFSVVPYFKKIQEYGAIENRDVWEYTLNLTPEEVDRIIGHAWELREVRFDYYFFRENCAFRLLELLDYARPSLKLIDQFNYTAIPAETVKAVVDSGIVSAVKFRPSVGSILQHRMTQLPSSSQNRVKDLYENPQLAKSDEFKTLPVETQRALVGAANQYLTYRSRRIEMTPEMVSRRFQMLKQVNRLPAQAPHEIPVPERPDAGHDTIMLNAGLGRDRDVDYQNIGFRISYHDLLDNSDGYLRGGEIQLGKLELRQYKGESLRLERADLIQLRSLGGWHSLFNTIAWEVGAGLRRHPVLENQKLGLAGEGTVGKSFMVTTNTVVYGLIGASAYFFDNAEHTAYMNPILKSGILYYNPLGTMKAQLFAEVPQRNHSRYVFSLSQNVVLAKNHSIRVTVRNDQEFQEGFSSASIEYRFHF